MSILTQARQLRLSPPPQTTAISGILYDPTSFSLALKHPDSSISLYPNISPFSSPLSLSTSAVTALSPPSSAAAFLHLRSTGFSRVMFIVSSPHLAGNYILLRFYILGSDKFARVRVCCNNNNNNSNNKSEMFFDEKKFGVLIKVNHGVSVKVVGSVNVFALYSVSDSKVRVYAVKSVFGEGDEVKLMKTAVIDCELPVFSISVSGGFLMLGEENGVRVFNLRTLVKGKVKKFDNKVNVKKVSLVNGMVSDGGSVLYVKNGKEKIGKHSDNSVKLKPVKMRQNSNEGGVRFVAFKSKEFEDQNSSKVPSMSLKAISIHFLAHNKFLILDSHGELYLLSLSNPNSGSGSTCDMKKLTLTMKVQNLAVLPDDSTRAQTVWVSDGEYTIHAIIVSDTESPADDNDTKDIEERLQSMATKVIFTSEKIQEIIPLAANAVLLLGQANNIFAYAIS
uniref:uncharacterized protein LOC122590302 n=1 Tax=Erigeron canadensis TaxID=72917 RepID=UPI001CB88CA4|nr:uncharacterized protein LOC122590302 [Erigeron canadensis]